VFVRRIFISRFVHKSGVRTNVASVIGEQGVVIETIDKVKSTGKVRVNKEVWTAKAEHDEVIPLDQIVTVVRVDGVKLIIRKG
jgi:membrane protein implicated in regulation of membrane protease activity